MARKDWDAEGLRELFAMLDHAHGILREVVTGVEQGKPPTLYIHAETMKNKYLKQVQDWSDTLQADYTKQLREWERSQTAHKAKRSKK